ncbi:MAG: hypothetical protein KatS3mg081_2599 [Gemmatimonadales bacterium]|nr:MAG: hypothetical protein KatS3mg081_2599 [Gemmatimonadales bacterium]
MNRSAEAICAAWSLLLQLGLASVAGAQDRPPQPVPQARLDSVMRRVESMQPRSGPPGTAVTLRSGRMPALTPLRIGMGAVRFGFEEIAQVMTDEKGEFQVEVRVPSWARRDLTHRFIVFDFYFNPIALSDLFFVTDGAGVLERAGEVVSVDAPCPVLRAEDGTEYWLSGDLSGLRRGALVVVEGKLAGPSTCPEEAGIVVERVRSGPRSPGR